MNLKFQISNFKRDPRSKIQDPRGKILNFKPQTSNFKLVAVFALILLFQTSCSDPRVSESPSALSSFERRPRVETGQAQPARMVSLAPSITEILFSLGLGDRVTGVTRFCDYPPEALEKAKVGGYFDINYEAVMALEPDLAIHLSEHGDARTRLENLCIPTLAVDHSRVKGILESVITIAGRCGVKERGEELRCNLENRIQRIQELLTSASPRPRVVVAVGRSLQEGASGEIYISGRDGFYDDLIRLAGGENAYREETLRFPALSAEGLVRLDPDVIIEMIPDLSSEDDRLRLLARWQGIPGLRAASQNQVHIIGSDYAVVPGPRFIELLEEMGEIINRIED